MIGKRLTLTIGVIALALTLAGVAWAELNAAYRVGIENEKAELFETLPIAKQANAKPRTLVSLPPSQFGALHADDVIRAQAELEATICLKPAPGWPPQPCVGRMYRYNPKIRAQLFLAPSPNAKDPDRRAVSDPTSLSCSQRIPHRNRHCLLTISGAQHRLKTDCDGCHLNLVVSAHNRRARRGQRVTMGSFNDAERIDQGRAGLSLVRSRGAELPAPRLARKLRNRVPVVNEGRKPQRYVVYSLPIPVESGAAYYVESKLTVANDHLPYNTAIRNQIIVSRKRGSIGFSQTGRWVERQIVSPINGWTCTRGNSGHESPCTVRKGGVVRVKNSRSEPLYINLTVGSEAQILDGQRYRSGSKLRVLRGYLRAYKL